MNIEDRLKALEAEREKLLRIKPLEDKIAAAKAELAKMEEELAELLPPPPKPEKKRTRKSGGERRPRGERASLIAKATPEILGILKKSNVPLKTGAIADAITQPKDITAAALKEMAKAGTVTAKGERAQTVYSAAK